MLVGLGKNGTALLRTLTWFCQMDGYALVVDAYDKDANTERRIREKFPEILDQSFPQSQAEQKGEAFCTIRIHPEANVFLWPFEQLLGAANETPTLAFVSIGDDDLNIEAATKLRSCFDRHGWNPAVYAVVHDSAKHGQLSNIRAYQADAVATCFSAYDIRLAGSFEDIYDYEKMIAPNLELTALAKSTDRFRRNIEKLDGEAMSASEKLTLKTQEEEKIQCKSQLFWEYEYYRYSSTARTMFEEVLDAYGPLAQLRKCENPTEEELEHAREREAMIEHRRWNAYMRSEGYRWSGSIEASSRNNRGRLHNLLVPYDELPAQERAKDRR